MAAAHAPTKAAEYTQMQFFPLQQQHFEQRCSQNVYYVPWLKNTPMYPLSLWGSAHIAASSPSKSSSSSFDKICCQGLFSILPPWFKNPWILPWRLPRSLTRAGETISIWLTPTLGTDHLCWMHWLEWKIT